MSRDEFNKELQSMQEECLAFGVESRCQWPTYKNEETGKFSEATFADHEIFVGKWITIARIYRPFQSNVAYEIYPKAFRSAIARLAADLVHS